MLPPKALQHDSVPDISGHVTDLIEGTLTKHISSGARTTVPDTNAIVNTDRKSVRFVSITLWRTVLLFLGVVLPRFGISFVLGCFGMKFLAITLGLEDLLLNALALAFVLEIDELLFTIFVSQRTKYILSITERLVVCQQKHRKLLYLVFPINLCFGVFGAAITFTSVLAPFLDTINMARTILCDGNVDFIYTKSPSSELIQVTNSSGEPTFDYSDLAVLGIAQPSLTSAGDWDPAPDVLKAVSGSLVDTAFHWYFPQSADPTFFNFKQVVLLDNAELSTDDLICSDLSLLSSEAASRQHLQDLLGNSSIVSCSD